MIIVSLFACTVNTFSTLTQNVLWNCDIFKEQFFICTEYIDYNILSYNICNDIYFCDLGALIKYEENKKINIPNKF